ncbi:UDP-glycosyltransferase 708D1, partial [Mucuna pruriens]
MSGSEPLLHFAFLPSAGIGHLNPCLRIAALFLCYGCKVTLIITQILKNIWDELPTTCLLDIVFLKLVK